MNIKSLFFSIIIKNHLACRTLVGCFFQNFDKTQYSIDMLSFYFKYRCDRNHKVTDGFFKRRHQIGLKFKYSKIYLCSKIQNEKISQKSF